MLGLPHHFNYQTIDDVNLKELQIVGQMADNFANTSKSDALRQLKEALYLSDKAKRFAITREIHLSNNFKVVFEAMIIAVSMLFGVGLGSHFIVTRNIRRNLLVSFVIRLLSAAFGLCLWFISRQMCYYSLNCSADECAVNQGTDYYEGALEYYEKQMQKNAALYALLGESGRKKFTEDGEEKGLFSTVPSFKKRIGKIKELNATDDHDKESEKKSEE